jgi:hypothetical protein
MSAKISTRDSAKMIAAIAAGEDFQTHGGLRGEAWKRDTLTSWDCGQLPTEHVNRLMIDHLSGDLTYVIFSYQTPIAWKMRDGHVRRPRVRYSVTTSQHQGKAGYVLGE